MLILFACSCHHRPAKTGENEKPVDLQDFIRMFPVTRLPADFADSSLRIKPEDSLLTAGVLRQFIPDSVFDQHWGRHTRSKFYASGRVEVKKGETYLLLKFIGVKKALYLLAFDNDKKFSALLTLVYRDEDPNIRFISSMDSKYTVTVNRQHQDAGKTLYRKSVYVFNADSKAFTLIMTESNENKPKPAQIYNPIDTLPRKHKFTGDYIQDKVNFIAFRDGRNNNVIRFFVHFEKDQGSCTGELKGEARFVSANTARYTANGDPCSLQFVFTDHNVRMKEIEGCGNHRGIRCYFDGTYEKHKPPVKPKSKNNKIK